MPRPPDHATLERLKQITGPAGWSDDPDTLAPHLVEWRSRYQGKTPLLLKPANTAEVAEIVRVCAAAEVGIVPQGETPAWWARRSRAPAATRSWSTCRA